MMSLTHDRAARMAAAMRAALRDREDAWAFLTGFVADWRMPLRPGDGHAAADLDAATERLGLTLPAALREAHALLGRRDDVCGNAVRLLPPGDLHVAGGALVYAADDQGAARWGIPLDGLGADDPATVTRPDPADGPGRRWEPWAARLSAAVMELVMTETLRYGDGLSDAGDMTALAGGAFEPLPSLLPPDLGSRWLLGEDALLHVSGGSWITVRARSREALDAVRAAVTADWVNGLSGRPARVPGQLLHSRSYCESRTYPGRNSGCTGS